MKPRVRIELVKALILIGLLGAAVFFLNPKDFQVEGAIPTGVRGLSSPGYGRWLYATNCVGCHGYDGKGNGWLAWTMFVKVPPPDFTDEDVMAARTDEQLYRSIAEGMHRGRKKTMRGFAKSLSTEEIWRAVAYVRSFAEHGSAKSRPVEQAR